jgi:hypothetical protein
MRRRWIAACIAFACAAPKAGSWAQDPQAKQSTEPRSSVIYLGSTARPRKYRRVIEGSSGAMLLNPPPKIMDFLGVAAGARAEAHSQILRYPSAPIPFLDQFDSGMPGLAALTGDVRGLLAEASVASDIEPVTDEGDDQKRTLKLDWILKIRGDPTQYAMRRKIVTITVEKRKKGWKFTAFDPIDFFKPPF